MKAVVFTGYGDLERLAITEIPKPDPGPEELLVRVVATSVNPLDWKLRRGMLRMVWPLKFPFVPGFDFAGVVDSVGESVTCWRPGDAVMAVLTRGGAHAEYVAVEQSLCVAKPPSIPYEQCASAPAAAVSALQALRNIARVQPGQRVAINGASGGVGSFAVQIAKAFDCHVTAVCSQSNFEFAESLGADEVIDYRQRDVLQSGTYDVFFDVVPNRSFRKCRPVLNRGGVYVTTSPGLATLGWKLLAGCGRLVGFRKRCGMLMLKPNRDDLREIADLMEQGQVGSHVEVLDSLDAIREAHSQSETGHVRGKIVIRVDQSPSESDDT